MDKNIGKKYGKLIIIKLDHKDKYLKYYLCKCDCGNEKVVLLGNLKMGYIKSCGCLYQNIGRKVNKYRKMKDYIIGYATNTNNKFYIDIDDFDKVKKYSWYEQKNGYLYHKEDNKKSISLHRYITNCPDGMVVDHINHNKKDNRKANLKVCTQKENANNRKNKAIGITKIYRNKNIYYIVQLKGKYLGCYKDYNDALKVRNTYID